MIRLMGALLAVGLVAGCAPLAFFASSSGSGYRGLDRSMGTFIAHNNVNAICLSPALRLVIWDFEGHFGKKVVMSSGYRDPAYNGKVGGADASYHMKCMAADFHIPGVPKEKLIAYGMRHSGVGGLGCYYNHVFIHVDVRERPRGWNRPVTFSC
jgi:zinc D-Ala-D-Ala carboxypeptidase